MSLTPVFSAMLWLSSIRRLTTVRIVDEMTLKVVRVTMDSDLVERVDRRAKRLGTTRSRFIREALRVALERYAQAELEEIHRAGYRENLLLKQEFGLPEGDHAWGDGPWKDE